MFLEKVKLFWTKNKNIKSIITCILIGVSLYGIVQLYLCYHSTISDSAMGIIGTLLGAFVGGCFTLMGSLVINKQAQKAVNAIKRKNVIYKPLYDELMEIHSEILIEQPYPAYIVFEKQQQTMLKHPQYTVWGRIRKDARFFEVPKKLNGAMEELYEAIGMYLEKRKNAVIALDKVYREELNRIANRQIPDQANVGSMLLNDLLSGKRPDDGRLMWDFEAKKQEEAETMWNSLCNHANNNVDLIQCKTAKKVWYKKEETVLKLLGLYIQYITVKYEG